MRLLSYLPSCLRPELRHCPAVACPLVAELAPQLVAAVLAVLPVAVHLASVARPLSAVHRSLFLCLYGDLFFS